MRRSLMCILAALLAGCSAMPVQSDRVFHRPLATSTAPSLLRAQLSEAVRLITNLEYDKARPLLLQTLGGLERSGDLNAAAEATFWLGYIAEAAGQSSLARNYYARVLRTYPFCPAARLAEDRLGRLGEG